jgi:hypothetical protein
MRGIKIQFKTILAIADDYGLGLCKKLSRKKNPAVKQDRQ